MAKPSVFPDFAMTDVIDPTSGQPNVVEPSDTKKNVGWVYNEKPPRQYFNWLARTTSLWIHYLSDAIDVVFTWIGNICASVIPNDSSVSGETCKDALDTLGGDVATINGTLSGVLYQINVLQNAINNIVTVPIGTILPFYSTSVPNNYLLCDGSNFNSDDYPELYALLGSTTLPDLRGQFLVGYKSTDTDYNAIGKTGGEKRHTLAGNEIPAHSHLVNTYQGYSIYNQQSGSNIGGYIPSITNGNNEAVLSNSPADGGGDPATPHENRPPFVVVSYIIRAK